MLRRDSLNLSPSSKLWVLDGREKLAIPSASRAVARTFRFWQRTRRSIWRDTAPGRPIGVRGVLATGQFTCGFSSYVAHP